MNRKKKIGKIWRERSGVSPAIAVVLMVAITVVLAGTIYIWLGGDEEATGEIDADIGIHLYVGGEGFNIVHEGGNTITNAFNPSINGTIGIADWRNMQMDINDQILGTDAIGKAKIKPTVRLNGINVTTGIKDFKEGDWLAILFDTPPTSGDIIKAIYTPTDTILALKG